jgi:predicted NBD/HSP70 family sugar kinase
MGDIVSLKTGNIVNVIKAVKNHAPITKGEISERIGITAVSAHNIVNDLLEHNIIEEAGVASKSGNTCGRRAAYYELNPAFGYVIGQRMTRGAIETGIYSFDSKCLAYENIDIPVLGPDATIRAMVGEMEKMISSSGIGMKEVIGAGVTWPGQVDYASGTIINLPNNPGYEGIQAKHIMERHMAFPIFMDNDVKSVVFALKWQKSEYATDDFVYFASKPEGVGSGVLCEGKLLRGDRNNAGEIAHVRFIIDGQSVSVENFLQDYKLFEKCRVLLEEANALPRGSNFGPDSVISLANERDGTVMSVLNSALTIIMMCIDIFVKMYDPRYILLNIEWLKRTPELYETLAEMFRRDFVGTSYDRISMTMVDIEHLETLGAATLFFNDFFTNKTAHNSLFKYCVELLKKRGK